MMFTCELKKTGPGELPDELEIYLDADGLQSLLAQLAFLKGGRTDHIHLMSKSWGGAGLDDEPRTDGATIIHHIKINYGTTNESGRRSPTMPRTG